MSTRIPTRLLAPLFALAALALLGARCGGADLPEAGAVLFTSPQVNPVALSADGTRLYVANTTSGSVSVVDVSNPAAPSELAQVRVGLDPSGIAVRPKASPGDAELVFVTNHISDSISVIDAATLDVVQTIQEIDPATGVSLTNEPVGIVFDGPNRAFVSLDEPNQVIVLDLDAAGRATIRPQRLSLTAQGPRAMAVADGRLYVAAFESGNQTEFPMCAADDTRGLDESDPFDEGCEFNIRLIDGILDFVNFDLDIGVIIDFAAGSPNIGGRVIRDRDVPDRDLFVYDLATLELVEVIEGVGTLLYGMAPGANGRLYVTHTEARNQLDGLDALENRMFDNRLAVLDCAPGGCGAPSQVDLETAPANTLGVTVPTPYGIAASGDGAILVVSAAGSDGLAPSTPGTPAGQAAIPGLVTLDAAGNVLGAVQTGAIPQGLALASDASGAATTAYVLNTVDSTLSVVDVSTPSAPQMLASLTVGSDPTPALVRKGRIAFSSARASTSGTFSCESCHPNGNMDQLIWSINTVSGPDEGPDPSGEHAEPRTTMPIRGLRDTLPLHWDGSLGDPFGGPNGSVGLDVDLDPNCTDELDCFRHLANASLSGVMCDPAGGGCPTGVATSNEGAPLPGALDDADRDALAAFMGSVSYPPSPRRRPSDTLSAQANLGVQDFFTDEDGLGVGGGSGVGAAVGFSPITCADNSGGCHALPLTVDTNSVTVGAFEAPSIRGLWDRPLMFSNGFFNSEETLTVGQACADGTPPPSGFLLDDPCTLDLTFAGLANLRPSFPSGEHVWDPAEGFTERGTWMASFEMIFDLAYGVPGTNIWEYVNEMSVGLPGITGRQLTIDPGNADAAETLVAMAEIEQAAAEGRITAIARNRLVRAMHFDPASGEWMNDGGITWTSAQLRSHVVSQSAPVTITAHLPENMTIGGADRQPLLDIEPGSRAAEQIGDLLEIPRPLVGQASTSTLGIHYVDPGATVFVDGEMCTPADGCTIVVLEGGGFEGADIMTLGLPPLTAGTHVVQVQNPSGWFSNEMPVFVEEGAL